MNIEKPWSLPSAVADEYPWKVARFAEAGTNDSSGSRPKGYFGKGHESMHRIGSVCLTNAI